MTERDAEVAVEGAAHLPGPTGDGITAGLPDQLLCPARRLLESRHGDLGAVVRRFSCALDRLDPRASWPRLSDGLDRRSASSAAIDRRRSDEIAATERREGVPQAMLGNVAVDGTHRR